MKVAIVHDYLKEYGGAERVLEALCEIYPDAPIYTAFYKKDSEAWIKFRNKTIRTSWVQRVPFFSTALYSPLRFLAPFIWGNFDFSGYDVVIGSAGWYVTKGFGKRPIEICYCHTPPRWLYGYKTSIEWQRYWPVRFYGAILGHFMRMYDYKSAQKVTYFIANSAEVAARIKKFYRRDATLIYPPVSLGIRGESLELSKQSKKTNLSALKTHSYFLIVSRIVGAKGLDLAIEAAKKGGFTLKIAGVPAGYYSEYKKLANVSYKGVEFLGHVSDEELVTLYAGAKAFLALAADEDFGITPVEAMACGTPVIAYRGGGYLETVIEGKTGVFFDELTVESLLDAIVRFDDLNHRSMARDCVKQAEKFSKERFEKEIKEFIAHVVR